MSIVREGSVLYHNKLNNKWEDTYLKLHFSGKLQVLTLAADEVINRFVIALGPQTIASPRATINYSPFNQQTTFELFDGTKNHLMAVDNSNIRQRWIELINFIALRTALQMKHPHPLTEVLTNHANYLNQIIKRSVLTSSTQSLACNWCPQTGLREAFICEFCSDCMLCPSCHRAFQSLQSPFVETPHHPFPLVDPLKARPRFEHSPSDSYTCALCSTDCGPNPLRCVECDDYAECRVCVAARNEQQQEENASPPLEIHLQPNFLAPVLQIDKNKFTLNKDRVHKCPRAASLISNRPWDLFTIDIIPASFAYFEVTFNKLNDKEGKVSVGIGNQIFVQNQMLGYQQNSFGYCCDGLLSQNTLQNVQQLPEYHESDTVGAGILLDSYNQRRIYFTLNGQLVGTHHERIHEGMDCFPGVSFMKGSAVEFTVNMTGPFKFDVSSIPDYRRDKTAYLSMLPPEITLQCLTLSSRFFKKALEIRLVNKEFAKLSQENDIWKFLYFQHYPTQNRDLRVKSWYNMFKRRYKATKNKPFISSSDGGIENCAVEFECPLTWENLTPKAFNSDSKRRQCNKCHKTVYKVDNTKKLQEYVQMGRCVSLQLPRQTYFMGAYAAPPNIEVPPLDLVLLEDYNLPNDDDF